MEREINTRRIQVGYSCTQLQGKTSGFAPFLRPAFDISMIRGQQEGGSMFCQA